MATNDSKISALTANTAPATTDLLLLIDDPSGTALSQKITVANLLQLSAAAIRALFGPQTGITTSFAKYTQWSTDVLTLGSALTLDASNNKITVNTAGMYLVGLTGSATVTAAAEEATFAIYWNGATTNIESVSSFLATKYTPITAIGLVDVTTAATDFEVYVKMGTGTQDIEVLKAMLFAVYLGPT